MDYSSYADTLGSVASLNFHSFVHHPRQLQVGVSTILEQSEVHLRPEPRAHNKLINSRLRWRISKALCDWQLTQKKTSGASSISCLTDKTAERN